MRTLVPSGTPVAQAKQRVAGPWDRRLTGSDGVQTLNPALISATATASGTPHAEGAWTEVIASTAQDNGAIELFLLGNTAGSGADTSILVDVGVGGAGSEVVVIPDVQAGWRTSSFDRRPALGIFPLRIPRGSRVAVRCQALIASDTADIGVRLFPLNMGRMPPSILRSIGVDSANSRGTVLSAAPGGSTKGAWTELVASVSSPLVGVVISAGGGGDTTMASASGVLDIGVGASGAESVIVADVPFGMLSSETMSLYDSGVFAVDIPAGARISARYAVTAATGLDVNLIGVPA